GSLRRSLTALPLFRLRRLFRAWLWRFRPLRGFDVFDQGDGVFARTEVVPGHRLAPTLRQRAGLDRRGVALAVELDPEGEFVGQPASKGDAAAFVGAEEPALAHPVPGAEGDRADDDDHRQRLGAGAQPAAAVLAGDLLAPLARRGGGGPAADLRR